MNVINEITNLQGLNTAKWKWHWLFADMFLQSTNQWRNWEVWIMGGKLSWKRPTVLCRVPTSCTQEKKWEM